MLISILNASYLDPSPSPIEHLTQPQHQISSENLRPSSLTSPSIESSAQPQISGPTIATPQLSSNNPRNKKKKERKRKKIESSLQPQIKPTIEATQFGPNHLKNVKKKRRKARTKITKQEVLEWGKLIQMASSARESLPKSLEQERKEAIEKPETPLQQYIEKQGSFQARLAEIQRQLDDIGKKLQEIAIELKHIGEKLEEISVKLQELQLTLIDTAQQRKKEEEERRLKEEEEKERKERSDASLATDEVL